MNGTAKDGDRPEDRDAQDARLSAWLDGELDKEGAEDMSARISSDAALGQRVERLTRIDELVRAAVPEEPVPDALLQRLGLGTGRAEVVDLAAVRRGRAVSASMPAAGSRWSGQRLWRIAAQVLVIGGVGVGTAMWLTPHQPQGEPDAAYRTLSNAPRAVSAGQTKINAVVMFNTTTDATTARQIAQQAGVSLVGEPTADGAWKASVAPGRRDSVLATLRHDHRVTLAEPIDGADR